MVSYEEVISDFRKKVHSVFALYKVAITNPNPPVQSLALQAYLRSMTSAWMDFIFYVKDDETAATYIKGEQFLNEACGANLNIDTVTYRANPPITWGQILIGLAEKLSERAKKLVCVQHEVNKLNKEFLEGEAKNDK